MCAASPRHCQWMQRPIACVTAHNRVLAVCEPHPSARHLLYPQRAVQVAALPGKTGPHDGPVPANSLKSLGACKARRHLSLQPWSQTSAPRQVPRNFFCEAYLAEFGNAGSLPTSRASC